MGINTDAVQKLYVAYFNRPADVTGLAYWEGQLDAKKITIEGVAQSFSQQAEYTATYSGKSTAQVVDSIYQNLFGHSADIAGLKYWVGQLDNKVVNLGSAALAIANGATGNDALDVTNKVLAANAFTTAMDSTAKVLSYTGDAAYTAARTFLAGVTEVAATATAAVAAAPTVVAGLSSATNNGASTDTVLTTAQDIKTGTAGNDFFRAVAGAAVGSQDQTTLNSSDIIDGGLGQDQLIVNLTGSYQGGATIKNIETIKLGTDVTNSVVSFDYNVNAGVNEITGVNTIVYDQINAGETLNVNNLVAKADGTSAGTTVTTVVTTTTGGTSTSTTSTANSTAATNGSLVDVSWVNDNVNRDAGTIGVNYRGNTIAGTADNQKIALTNVIKGILNVDAGVETFTVNSLGTNGGKLNTLSNATGTTVDLTSGNSGAGNVQGSALTKVVVTSDASGAVFGTTPTANTRVVGTDTVGSDTAGLVSVAASVKEIDASNAAAGVNMRFTANTTPSDIAVKFTGGVAADYIEFERGDVNANGGAGNDTFAFITNAAGVTNATFGSTDTIVGGTGTDTIQIGLNGVGTYTLNTTEFNNKTGIDVLDVRGATTDITVSSEFVAGADAGKFVINTNKAGAGEAAATNVINTTALNQNQGIIVNGGAGSDRVVVNNASLNAAIQLDGGANGGVAGRYDTLTILNTTVADAGDLANVKGFEAMILAETVGLGNSRFDITLTDAFVLANTAATNDVATTIDDTVFRIGSAASSTGTALAAGDIVSIDISGLLNGARTGLATTLTGRGIDAAGFAAGVTVNYVVDGAAATAAQIALVTKADANRADAGFTSAAGVVVNNTPAVNVSSTAAIVTANATNLTGGAGTADVLTITDSGTITFGNKTTLFEQLVLSSAGANTVTQLPTSFTSVTGGTAADTVTLSTLTQAASLGDGVDSLTLITGKQTGAIDGGSGVDTLTLVTGSDISGATVTSFETLNAVGTNTLTAAQYNNFSTINSVGGGDTLTLATAGVVTVAAGNGGAGFETIVLANGTNNVTVTGSAAQIAAVAVTGGTGVDTLTIGSDASGVALGVNKTALENVVFSVNQAGGAVTLFNQAGLNVTSQAGGTFVLGTGGQNFTAVAGANTVTSAAGVDTFTLGTGADIIVTTGSLFGQTGGFDTVTGFNIAGADQFKNGVAAATTLNNLTIATADFTTLAGAIANAATAAGATLGANTQAYLITVTAGTAAGTYAFQNIGAGAANLTSVDAGDFIVKLVGAGTIVAGNFIL